MLYTNPTRCIASYQIQLDGADPKANKCLLLMEHMGIQAHLYRSVPMHEVKPVPVSARIFLRPRVKDQPPSEGCRCELVYAKATRSWLDDVAGTTHLAPNGLGLESYSHSL